MGTRNSRRPARVEIDGDDIGGLVTSRDGPEAGVWVIAATDDFDTSFARIVVTDNQGRYLVPDRSKCKGPLNGPGATGDHCPEGWTLHDLPGPAFPEEPGFSVESSYYTWVDQHNSLGLGENVPIATRNLFDGGASRSSGEVTP